MKQTLKFMIDLKQLKQNYDTACALVSPTKIAPVLKNNAYGLGLLKIGSELYQQARCENFFIDYVPEAIQLRGVAPGANIYILQGFSQKDLSKIKGYNLIPVISSLEDFKLWKNSGITYIKPVLQVDTGLNRLGFREEDLRQLTNEDKKIFGMCMSHLACADLPNHPLNKKQLLTMKGVQKSLGGIPLTLSASSGIYLGREYHCDMLRLGNALFGLKHRICKDFKPVVSISAPVLQIAHVKKGENVGYKGIYNADSDKKIAVLGIGFGDGLFRSLASCMPVFFGQEPAPIIGSICMDCTIVDVSHINQIEKYEEASVIGQNYTLDEMAAAVGTLPTEVLSHLGNSRRFQHVYI